MTTTTMNPTMRELLNLCKLVYKQSLDQKAVIDYSDMILLPLVHGARIWPKKVVLLDEAQDTNPARRALAMKALAPDGVFVAVGDDHQAINGFTGADSDSLDLIEREFDTQVLPLNVTYRCPKSVVRLAQQWVPDFQAHEDNPEGEVETVNEDDFWAKTLGELTNQDAILCRNTKPLVALAYTLLRQGRACRVEGREIGEGLIALAQRWKIKTLSQLTLRLEAYKARETAKWAEKGMEDKIQAVEDKVDTLALLIEKLTLEGKKEILDLVSFINSMFADTEGPQTVLTLSTVHKSKGREWGHVCIWGRNAYMPSKYARKDWQLVQEDNLQYVAVTRAKSKLTEVIVEV